MKRILGFVLIGVSFLTGCMTYEMGSTVELVSDDSARELTFDVSRSDSSVKVVPDDFKISVDEAEKTMNIRFRVEMAMGAVSQNRRNKYYNRMSDVTYSFGFFPTLALIDETYAVSSADRTSTKTGLIAGGIFGLFVGAPIADLVMGWFADERLRLKHAKGNDRSRLSGVGCSSIFGPSWRLYPTQRTTLVKTESETILATPDMTSTFRSCSSQKGIVTVKLDDVPFEHIQIVDLDLNGAAQISISLPDVLPEGELKGTVEFDFLNGERVEVQTFTLSLQSARTKRKQERVVLPVVGDPTVDSRGLSDGSSKTGLTKTITLPGGATMELVWCPPGSFMMGSPASEAERDDDEVQHSVTLTKGFWLGKYEVTQRQWESVMGTNPSRFQSPDRPVEQVSWEDCQVFIRTIREASPDLNVRLPTEAEWEYACRAGTESAYSGSGVLGDMGWYDDISQGETHVVGQRQANAWGLHDMHGNVWEWCSDVLDSYPEDSVQDPVGPKSGACRVNRGGSWGTLARSCRSADRNWDLPSDRSSYLGFRLCCSAGPRD